MKNDPTLIKDYNGSVRLTFIDIDVLTQLFEGRLDELGSVPAVDNKYIGLIGSVDSYDYDPTGYTATTIVRFENGYEIIVTVFDIVQVSIAPTDIELLPVAVGPPADDYIKLTDADKAFADTVFLTLIKNQTAFDVQTAGEFYSSAIAAAIARNQLTGLMWYNQKVEFPS